MPLNYLLLTTSFLLVSFSALFDQARAQTQDSLPPLAPDIGLTPLNTPSPLLPQRGSLPPGANISLPAILNEEKAKVPLAWRAKINRLSQESQKSGKTTNCLSRAYDKPFADCLLALINACSKSGFQIESLNSNAGELLVSQTEMVRQRLLFLVCEMPAGRSTIFCAPDEGTSLNEVSNQIQKIFDNTTTVLNKRGRI
ncbi:MAG: hypothetical protein K2W82_14090 [Candidatus Obscuribacterales bacterium]|nr:hypothetical protein [Candidatus Obscuribacterales bacterium]